MFEYGVKATVTTEKGDQVEGKLTGIMPDIVCIETEDKTVGVPMRLVYMISQLHADQTKLTEPSEGD